MDRQVLDAAIKNGSVPKGKTIDQATEKDENGQQSWFFPF